MTTPVLEFPRRLAAVEFAIARWKVRVLGRWADKYGAKVRVRGFFEDLRGEASHERRMICFSGMERLETAMLDTNTWEEVNW